MAIQHIKSDGSTLRLDFGNEGVSLVVPWQGYDVEVRKLDLPDNLPSVDYFTPTRPVINFEIYNVNFPDVPLTEFDPPLELAVSYQIADLFAAQRAGRSLKLAFWDGQIWQLFSEEKHNLKLLPPSTGTVATLQIARWGDPSVSWGR